MVFGKVIGGILITIFILTTFFMMIGSLESDYIDSGISPATKLNQTNLAGSNISYASLDKTAEINATFAPIMNEFTNLDQESGWFLVTDTAISMAKASVKIPGAMVSMIGIAMSFVTSVGLIIGIPEVVINIAIVGLFVFMILIGISFLRRSEV